MSNDIEGLERFVCAYDKQLDEGGDQEFIAEYKLEDIDIEELRDIFAISPDEKDPVIYDLILPLKINAEQAVVLQEFVKDATIDTDKYDYFLESYLAEGYDDWEVDDEDTDYEDMDE